jgi:putative ABC transport system permease protein
MLRNYLKIAYRSLLRHKLFSLINISGLAVGMAASLLILQYASFELSYDNFHENADDVYRIAISEGTLGRPMVPPPLGPGLKENFPELHIDIS